MTNEEKLKNIDDIGSKIVNNLFTISREIEKIEESLNDMNDEISLMWDWCRNIGEEADAHWDSINDIDKFNEWCRQNDIKDMPAAPALEIESW